MSDDKVFCGEVADTRRGEDETSDGSIFALDLATGERLWQRAGGASKPPNRSATR